jgi:hypothetical protein
MTGYGVNLTVKTQGRRKGRKENAYSFAPFSLRSLRFFASLREPFSVVPFRLMGKYPEVGIDIAAACVYLDSIVAEAQAFSGRPLP